MSLGQIKLEERMRALSFVVLFSLSNFILAGAHAVNKCWFGGESFDPGQTTCNGSSIVLCSDKGWTNPEGKQQKCGDEATKARLDGLGKPRLKK